MFSFHPSIFCLAGAVIVLASPLQCGAADSEEKPPAVGERTEAILKLQAEGTAAAPHRPLSGEVASRSYQRYLRSFDTPIPDFKDSAPQASTSQSTN